MSGKLWLPVTPVPAFHDSMNRGDWDRAADYVRAIELELTASRRLIAYFEWRYKAMLPDVRRAIDSWKVGQEWEELC